MIEDQFLSFFITEDIYQLPEESLSEKKTADTPAAAPPKTLEVPPPPEIKGPKIHALAIWTPPLTTKDRELLTNILKAVNEDITKAYLMEGLAAYAPNYTKLLCFGYQKELELKVGKPIELYKPSHVSNRQILISIEPAELHNNGAEKKRLWSALQEMFLK